MFSIYFRKWIKFYENPFRWILVVLRGKESHTDAIKLIFASRNFANAPKKECSVEGFPKLAVSLNIRTRAACMPVLLVIPQVCRALSMREASVHICEHLPYMTADCHGLPILL